MKLPGVTHTPKWQSWAKELGIAAGIFGLVFWVGQGIGGGGQALKASSPAPSFELRDIRTSQNVTLDSLLGSPTALNFWGTWCGACRKELPALERLHRESGDAFKIVTIAHDPPARLKRFVSLKKGLSLPVLVDPPGAIHRAYGITAVPTTVVIDALGNVAEVFTGASSTGAIRQRLTELSR